MQQAEKLIGVQLFHRCSREVMQTDAGEVVVEASKRILSDLAQQVESARVLDDELRRQRLDYKF